MKSKNASYPLELDALLEGQYETPMLVEYGDAAELALGSTCNVKDYQNGVLC